MNRGRSALSRWTMALATLCAASYALADTDNLEEVIVQGSRLPASLETMPQSVDILKAEDIQTQLRVTSDRSEEHTSELQSRLHLVCRLLLEKKKRYRT